MAAATSAQAAKAKTRRGRRGRRTASTEIPPVGDKAIGEKMIGQIRTLSPMGGLSWARGAMGQDIFEAINSDTVTMEHRKMILEHPQMSAAMLIFGAFLASNRWKVKCEDPEVQAFAEALLKPIWRRLIRAMLRGVAFGFVPFERKYKSVRNFSFTHEESGRTYTLDKAIVYYGLKDLAPDSVDLYLDRDRYAGFAQNTYGVDRLEPEDTFWYAHHMEAGQLFGKARVNNGTKDFWVYNIVCWQHLMRYTARLASPPMKGRAPDGFRRKTDPDTGERTLWQPMQALHDAARGLQESGVIIMPSEETPSGKQKFDLELLMDSSPSVPRLVTAITESGHMMLYSMLLPPQMFESLTPGRGQGYGSVASLGGLAGEGVDEIMADMIDWIENGQELYGVPGIVQEPIRMTYGKDAPHVFLVPNKTSRNRVQLLADFLGQGIKSGKARINFDAIADELGVAAGEDEEFEPNNEGSGPVAVQAPGAVPIRDAIVPPPPAGRVQAPETL